MGSRTAGELLDLAVREAGRPLSDWRSRLPEPAATFDRLSEILGTLGDEDRALAELRTLTFERPASIDRLAATLGRAPQEVKRREIRLSARLSDLLDADPGCASLWRLLGAELGVAWRADRLDELTCLADRRLHDVRRFETCLLFRSVGRYELMDGWLVRRPGEQLVGASRRPVRHARWSGPLSFERAFEALRFLGIRPSMAVAWVDYLDASAVRLTA